MTAAERRQLQAQVWQSVTDDSVKRDGIWVYLLLKHWQVKLEELLAVEVGKTLDGRRHHGPCLTYRRVA